METSDALDLEYGVFTFNDQKRIAESPKMSAEQSSGGRGRLSSPR